MNLKNGNYILQTMDPRAIFSEAGMIASESNAVRPLTNKDTNSGKDDEERRKGSLLSFYLYFLTDVLRKKKSEEKQLLSDYD